MKLLQGDCLEVMKSLESNTIDAIITDPPYELGFMGKTWDSTGVANKVETWKECLRVLKPGGHLLAFSGTRTYHRMASAIEDAGFEVRDMIEWVYGSGFPKGLNIGKAVDKLQGNEREVVGKQNGARNGNGKNNDYGAYGSSADGKFIQTKGTSEWEGWGTALKPAHEPICLARKPLSEKTVAENCLKWGTGGINIDQSRVGIEKIIINGGGGGEGTGWGKKEEINEERIGRFPANLCHDNSEEVRECFPDSKSQGHWSKTKTTGFGEFGNGSSEYLGVGEKDKEGGNASRFFKSIIYTAKASKSERNKGCEGLEEKQGGSLDGKIPSNKNNHPTVKPIALMEYLIKMTSRENAIILDPFMGSGTTGIACKNLKRNFIGIELDKEYFNIAKYRIENSIATATATAIK